MQDIFASALKPVDLWALPTPDHSRWFARLDWYLNWRMCQGLAYSGLSLSPEIRQVAELHEVPIATLDKTPGCLLVATNDRLPTPRCMVVSGARSPETWLQEIASRAGSLQLSSLSIFLPTHVDHEFALKHWPASPHLQVHFVPDLAAFA